VTDQALRNAALAAAAANPEILPLEFLVGRRHVHGSLRGWIAAWMDRCVDGSLSGKETVPVTRNVIVWRIGGNDPPPKMTQGGNDPPPPKMTQGVMTPRLR
jgi:hypothetical protein